jgi:cell pole-organizing protein PopZ
MVKETAQAKDQSMEEILQSIKRIIAEEGSESAPANGVDHAEDSLVKGSEVLELKELSEDAPASQPILELTEELEESPEKPADSQPSPAGQLKAMLADDANRDVLADIDSLLSDETLKTSAAALRALNMAGSTRRDISRESAGFRSGVTVEDLVIEALKPMLKEWLDANLADLVRQLVEKEIRKLTT